MKLLSLIFINKFSTVLGKEVSKKEATMVFWYSFNLVQEWLSGHINQTSLKGLQTDADHGELGGQMTP